MVDVKRESADSYDYWEYNEYGIAYRRNSLISIQEDSFSSEKGYLDFDKCVAVIGRLIDRAGYFYQECAYSGTIEIMVQLRSVFDKKLSFHRGGVDTTKQQCIDSEVKIFTQQLAHCLEGEQLIDVIDELTNHLLWAFNVDAGDVWRRQTIPLILEAEWG